MEASGRRDEHPELRWCEYASGGTIVTSRFPADKIKPDRLADRQRDQDHPVECRRADDTSNQSSHFYGGTRCQWPQASNTQGRSRRNQGSRFKGRYATLFDTGAHASFVAAWIEDQTRTFMSSPILGLLSLI